VTIETRIAVVEDAASLARIHRECFDLAWDEESFRHMLGRSGALAILGSERMGKNPLAFVFVEIAADQSEILSIATVPNARGSGFARILLRQAMDEARLRGATEMFLEVAHDNEAALALYDGFGFVMTGRRRSYYGRPGGAAADALNLRAILSASEGHGNDLRTRLD